MGVVMIQRRCIHCHRHYPYNPSVGDLGRICKRCGQPQIRRFPNVPKPKKGGNS